MMLFHVALLPLVLGGIVVWHVLLVRKHGVVPPLGATDADIDGPAEPIVPAAEEVPS
jgi:quinol-cytochrome oxidoreductase complex cytochrome b subunit